MTTRKKLWLIVAVVMLAATLVSCAGTQAPTTTAETGTGTPTQTEAKTAEQTGDKLPYGQAMLRHAEYLDQKIASIKNDPKRQNTFWPWSEKHLIDSSDEIVAFYEDPQVEISLEDAIFLREHFLKKLFRLGAELLFNEEDLFRGRTLASYAWEQSKNPSALMANINGTVVGQKEFEAEFARQEAAVRADYEKVCSLLNEGKGEAAATILYEMRTKPYLSEYHNVSNLGSMDYPVVIQKLGEYAQEKAADDSYWKNLKDGDFVLFGFYEQDGNEFTKDPILWRVYRNQNTCMLRSVYTLDYVAWNSSLDRFHPMAQTWEATDIRSFLNGDFYQYSFSDKEKSRIEKRLYANNYSYADGNIIYSGLGGADTEDYLTVYSPYDFAKADNEQGAVSQYEIYLKTGPATRYANMKKIGKVASDQAERWKVIPRFPGPWEYDEGPEYLFGVTPMLTVRIP